MTIDVVGLERDAVLRARVEARMAKVVARLSVAPVSALVTLRDTNGPKGGVAIECDVTVRLPYRPAVRVAHTAATPRAAFHGAFETLDRQLRRFRTRQRDRRRRPRKYYAARRLLAPEGGREEAGE